MIMKKTITDFCKDKLVRNFIKLQYNFLRKNQLNMVRLLGFEPRTSWSVAKRSIQLSYKRTVNTIEYILKLSIVV